MEQENTHIIFDQEKVVISPNLYSIVFFLQKIESEINSFLGVQENLNDIRSQYIEMVGLVDVMSKVIKENNLDFKYKFSKQPGLMSNNLSHYRTPRSDLIVLFAGIETLICLYTAYDNETCDDTIIRNKVTDPKYSKSIINKFILNENNSFYNKNKQRFKKVDAQQLRNLRNQLAHFFSVKGLQVIVNDLEDRARKLEQKIGKGLVFISPNDLNQLYRNGSILLLRKWSEDCVSNPKEFERKIKFVKSIVEREGVILVEDKDLIKLVKK